MALVVLLRPLYLQTLRYSLTAGVASIFFVAMLAPTASAAHLFTGCGSESLTSSDGSSAATVQVRDFSFFDEASGDLITTVRAGESVTWTWVSPYCHSVSRQVMVHRDFDRQVPHDDFDSVKGGGGLDEPSGDADSFTVKFDTPGIYSYFCQHHQGRRDDSNHQLGMRGVVIVSA